jgi:hypothetical protein
MQNQSNGAGVEVFGVQGLAVKGDGSNDDEDDDDDESYIFFQS